MSPERRPLRAVQWTTGNIGHQTVRALLAHRDLVLVGAYAHSKAKVGRDVAALCGLDEPTGVLATDDSAPSWRSTWTVSSTPRCTPTSMSWSVC